MIELKRKTEQRREIALDFKIQGTEVGEAVRKVIVLECGIVNPGGTDMPTFEPGTELFLERESMNAYDRWAILAKTDVGRVLGYLPSGKNQSVARMIDAGKHIRAFVVDSTAPDYQDALKVYGFSESKQVPLRLFWELPIKEETR